MNRSFLTSVSLSRYLVFWIKKLLQQKPVLHSDQPDVEILFNFNCWIPVQACQNKSSDEGLYEGKDGECIILWTNSQAGKQSKYFFESSYHLSFV